MALPSTTHTHTHFSLTQSDTPSHSLALSLSLPVCVDVCEGGLSHVAHSLWVTHSMREAFPIVVKFPQDTSDRTRTE